METPRGRAGMIGADPSVFLAATDLPAADDGATIMRGLLEGIKGAAMEEPDKHVESTATTDVRGETLEVGAKVEATYVFASLRIMVVYP